MNKILLLTTLILSVAGCSNTPKTSRLDIPTTSQLVLMAAEASKDKTVEETPAMADRPFDTSCNKIGDNGLDFNVIFNEAKKQYSGPAADRATKPQTGFTCNGLTDEFIKAETGLTCNEIKQAAELLKSGQFRSDIRGLVFLAISTVPTIALTLPQTGEAIHNEIMDLKSKQPEILHRCKNAIFNGKSCIDLNVFERAYDDPSTKLTRDTLVVLLKNKSFRLALIVYAHSNGVDINNADLDFVQHQLEQTDIDIQALIDEGEKRLKEKYNVKEAEARIDALSSSCR
jgi:hypothetical protein